MDKDSTLQLSSDSQIPVIGFGTWQLTNDTSGTINHALQRGYLLIDTSSDYGTQPGIGQGIKNSGTNRKNIYLTTKVEETDDAYERAESNLQELQLDYVNLLLIHRPPSAGAGEELWEGLIKAKNDGLTRDIGVSNYSTTLIDQLIDVTGETPVVNQIEWSPFGHSKEMLQYCRDKKIIIMAYSPLTRTTRLDDPKLNQIFSSYGKTPAQILIRWNLQLGTIPIPKANEKRHLEENLDVFDFEISEDYMSALSGLNEHYSALGKLPYV